jgi:hypothetical protein
MTFIMNSDPSTSGFLSFSLLSLKSSSDLYQSLQYIYNNIYVECVTRNPLYRHNPNDKIDCPLFIKRLEDYVSSQLS